MGAAGAGPKNIRLPFFEKFRVGRAEITKACRKPGVVLEPVSSAASAPVDHTYSFAWGFAAALSSLSLRNAARICLSSQVSLLYDPFPSSSAFGPELPPAAIQ